MLTINEQITLNNINAITKQALQTKYNFINNEDYKLSPVSTYLAACAAIMSHKEAELKDIMKTACDYHIEENIKDFVKLHIKEAEYALDGERLPIDTTENAQKSAENFSENYTKLPISQRFKAAELIYKKLANKNIDLPIPLLAYANSDAIRPDNQAAITIMKRAQYSSHENMPYYQCLAEIATMTNSTRSFMKIAHSLENLDRLNKITVRPVIEDLFVKRAEPERESDYVFLNGTQINKNAITKEKLEQAFGPDMLKSFYLDGKLHIAAINALPKSDKEMLLTYIKEE